MTARTRYALTLLALIYVLSYLDRQVVAILAEPIKLDLHLSDTQVGLMAGLAFSIFYTALGLPLARLADHPRSDRVTLISVALAFWSVMTAACGLSQSFVQLLLARLGVGVGEAGSTPAAHALISDAVPPARRSRAMAFYGLGLPVGSLLAFVLGGFLTDTFGWRTAFLVMGLPGVALALLFRATVRDPRTLGAAGEAPRSTTAEAVRALMGSRAFVMIFLGASTIAFLGFGKSIWSASYFIRRFGMTPGEVGLWYGVCNGLAGMAGTWLGGRLAARSVETSAKGLLAPSAVGLALAFPFLALGYSAGDWRTALALISVGNICTNLYYGPMFAAVQGVTAPAQRATAVSIISFGQNMIGLGLGPLTIGFLSDQMRPLVGGASVQVVLTAVSVLWLAPALVFWRASPHLAAEMRH